MDKVEFEKIHFVVAQYDRGTGRLIGRSGGEAIDTEEKAHALAERMIAGCNPDFLKTVYYIIEEHLERVTSREVGVHPIP